MNSSMVYHLTVGFCFLAFGMHQVFQKILGIRSEWIDSYADPFWGIIIALYLHKINPVRIKKQNVFEIMIVGVAFMCISEWIFPIWAPHKFTADGADLLSITLGTISYLFIHLTNERSSHTGPSKLI